MAQLLLAMSVGMQLLLKVGAQSDHGPQLPSMADSSLMLGCVLHCWALIARRCVPAWRAGRCFSIWTRELQFLL